MTRRYEGERRGERLRGLWRRCEGERPRLLPGKSRGGSGGGARITRGGATINISLCICAPHWQVTTPACTRARPPPSGAGDPSAMMATRLDGSTSKDENAGLRRCSWRTACDKRTTTTMDDYNDAMDDYNYSRRISVLNHLWTITSTHFTSLYCTSNSIHLTAFHS